MTADERLDFYTEVRVVEHPRKPELQGQVGAVLGISEPSNPDTPPSYAVMLDHYDRVVQFSRSQITPTGRMRKRADYYDDDDSTGG